MSAPPNRCPVNIGGHEQVNGCCLFCSEPTPGAVVQSTPEVRRKVGTPEWLVDLPFDMRLGIAEVWAIYTKMGQADKGTLTHLKWAIAEINRLLTERHSTSEALSKAVERVADLEKQLATARARALDEGADELTQYSDRVDPNCHCGDLYGGCPSCIARDHADTLRGMAREAGESR